MIYRYNTHTHARTLTHSYTNNENKQFGFCVLCDMHGYELLHVKDNSHDMNHLVCEKPFCFSLWCMQYALNGKREIIIIAFYWRIY